MAVVSEKNNLEFPQWLLHCSDLFTVLTIEQSVSERILWSRKLQSVFLRNIQSERSERQTAERVFHRSPSLFSSHLLLVPLLVYERLLFIRVFLSTELPATRELLRHISYRQSRCSARTESQISMQNIMNSDLQ